MAGRSWRCSATTGGCGLSWTWRRAGWWWKSQFGKSGDWPVPADYDGDGKVDLAVYRPSENRWYVRTTAGVLTKNGEQFGMPGDWPVPADYDGDGRADLAVYRALEGRWVVSLKGRGHVSIGLGDRRIGDVPMSVAGLQFARGISLWFEPPAPVVTPPLVVTPPVVAPVAEPKPEPPKVSVPNRRPSGRITGPLPRLRSAQVSQKALVSSSTSEAARLGVR